MPSRNSDTPSVLPPEILLRNALHARGPDDFFVGAEVAIYSGLARRTIRNVIARGELLPDGRGREMLFRRRTVDAWLASRVRGDGNDSGASSAQQETKGQDNGN